MPKFKNSNETFWWFSNIVEFTFWLFWCICRPENLQRVTRLKSFRSLEKSLISWFKIGTVYYVTGWRHHERFVYLKKPSSPKANNFRKQTGKLHWNCLFCIWSKNPDLWVLHYILGWSLFFKSLWTPLFVQKSNSKDLFGRF